MIERQIRQLHEVGITDITIAVGYLKEKFEYLIDKYQVKLLYNPEYASKNTLTTIYRAREVLAGKNMYILSSDNWLRDNMFHAYEVRCLVRFFLYGGIRRNGCLSFNKRDASPMWRWADTIPGSCTGRCSFLHRFPNSFCLFWSSITTPPARNSFTGRMC
ncbi:MAG: hypothetical protein ACLUD2_07935 [Clostridium sp.]